MGRTRQARSRVHQQRHGVEAGRADDAPTGAACIRSVVERADGRITVMPRGGITPDNIAAIARATGAREFHASAKVRIGDRMYGAQRPIGDMHGDHWQTDEETVRRCVETLAALSSSSPSPTGHPPA